MSSWPSLVIFLIQLITEGLTCSREAKPLDLIQILSFKSFTSCSTIFDVWDALVMKSDITEGWASGQTCSFTCRAFAKLDRPMDRPKASQNEKGKHEWIERRSSSQFFKDCETLAQILWQHFLTTIKKNKNQFHFFMFSILTMWPILSYYGHTVSLVHFIVASTSLMKSAEWATVATHQLVLHHK